MRGARFKKTDGPPPLCARARRVVRFEDCDPLGIMWHGRYPSFLEDAREKLGQAYGIGYLDFYGHGVVMPIKNLCIDYIAPLNYRSEYTIQAMLHWSDAARLDIEYEISGPDGQIVTRASTVQLMLTVDNVLLMEPPQFYMEFRRKWREGPLHVPVAPEDMPN